MTVDNDRPVITSRAQQEMQGISWAVGCLLAIHGRIAHNSHCVQVDLKEGAAMVGI